jgi:hypothetical protein
VLGDSASSSLSQLHRNPTWIAASVGLADAVGDQLSGPAAWCSAGTETLYLRSSLRFANS